MFKKKLQNYFKKFFKILFKFIYGKIVYKEKNLDHKNITISKIDNSIIQKFHNKSYQVYQIKNARVYNDTVENVAIINQNQILDKISYQQQNGKLCQANSSVILSKGTPRIKKKIKSNLFILSQGASGNENYFHWMFYIIPKLRILNEVYKYEKIDFFYFSKLKKWQKDILDIMGLKNIKILNSKAEHFDSNDKIFIDRSESKFKHCQIINDIEVSNFLESKGFTKYKVGQLPFKRQISLFKNAKIIVGAHGAAFANLIFCEPRTKIIEIKPKNHPNYFSRKISEINNLNYELIETEIIPDDKKNNGDIYLDLKYLEKIV